MSKMPHWRWSKSYYEKADEELLRMVPRDAQRILSVGCGWGFTESKLKEREARVTALPLDSVIGAAAARRGIEVVYGTIEDCLVALRGRRFDAVLISNLLHLQRCPDRVLEQCCRFVGNGGTLVVAGPNFRRFKVLLERAFGIGAWRKLRRFEDSGISLCDPVTLAGAIKNAGLHVSATRWVNHSIDGGSLRGTRIALGRLTAKDWLLQARR